MAKTSLRTWATPLTLGAFFLMAASGVLMFFEWHHGLTVVVHQWFSWIFLFGVASHVATHVRPFNRHLQSRAGKASLAVFASVLVASFFSWGQVTGPNLEQPIEQALVDAPLHSLALLTRTDDAELLRRLRTHGIPANERQTLREVGTENHVGMNRLMAIVFLDDQASE